MTLSQGKDIFLFQNTLRWPQTIVFFTIQPTFLAVFWPSVKLAVCSLLLSFDHYFFYCLVVSHQDWKTLTATILWNDLLFKQPSNDISDREIRLQSLSGFSEIKSLIDGRKDEKGFLSQYCQWLWLKGSLNRATFELRQSRH